MSNRNEIPRTSRELRKNQTSEEKILWEELRNRTFNGFKFLRQHSIVIRDSGRPEFYVVDFNCAEKRLIVELDGKIHNFQKQYVKDREDVLLELGYKIIRIRNEEIAEMEKVFKMIEKHLL